MDISELEARLASLTLGNDEEAADGEALEMCSDLVRNQETNGDTLAKAAETLATCARNKDNREVLGANDELVVRMLALLHEDSTDMKVRLSCACFLGNVVFQNESAREFVADQWAPAQIIALISNVRDAEVLVNVGTAIDNVTKGDKGMFQRGLLASGIVDALTPLLKHKSAAVVAMAASNLGTIASAHAPSLRSMGTGEVMKTIIKNMLKPSSDERVCSSAIELLSTLLNNNPSALESFITGGGIDALILLGQETLSDRNRDQLNTYLSGILALPEVQGAIIAKGILKEQLRICSSGSLATQQIALKVIGYCATNSECLPQIFAKYKIFVKKLADEDAKIRLHSTMIVSNIARTDEYCRRLLQEGVVPKLVELCRNEVDVQFKHLAAGCIRNLAIPPANKERVGSVKDIFGALIEMVPHENPFVANSAVMAIKVLCTNIPANTERFLANNGLSVLVDKINADLPDEQKRIQYEASRMIASNALESCFRAKLVQCGEPGLASIRLLLSSPFAILQQEGFQVVQRLLEDSEHGCNVLVSGGIVPALVLMSASGDATLRVETLNLLKSIARDPAVRACLLGDAKAKFYLEPIASGSTPASGAAAELLQALTEEPAR
eukprot:TRINITY_DN652_c1_g1_i2.p1 TRINITY_DN652_c1_g1~~TRINITY_DN652_c1_g1_i2.p1  ORF type:complete len:633 (+),score=135.77 TRINITY_DN652_c1_g1_i2:58-1899(+)